ncbi:MAG TPA: tripartite tricarboxylate transporter substrate-binding protein [Falsiroseomonas sp.]|jgi:tripartite-type tricarboxylate transporter receptor subunit TctC|nr:tripartite tricarboxylate transporter substrate-binding protein [Falsiroseomonas sp.]
MSASIGRTGRRGLLGGALALPGLGLGAAAQSARPITIVAPFPAGGSSDILARVVAERLGPMLGRSVVVENVSGAGGRIAARGVEAAAPDGTRLLLANTSVAALTPLTDPQAGYDPLRFVPVAGAAEFAAGLASGPMTRATTLAELTAWLRANPTQANYGVPATGSLPHLTGILYGRVIGLEMTVVPYRGGAPIAQDLLAGNLAVGIAAAADFAGVHQGGRARLLAVTGTRPAPGLPDVPTFTEAGLAGFEANAWTGFFAPPGTPEALVAPIGTAIRTILADATVRARLEQVALIPVPADGATLRAWLERDRASFAPLLAAAGLGR